jgi:Flp pilus assembly pilin Flp
MSTRKIRREKKGQGLVEYALIIALVAVVVIVAAAVVGLAVQRVYGVIVAALGTKHDAVGHLEIESAQCIASTSLGKTGLIVYGYTTDDPSKLTASSELTVGTSLDGSMLLITSNGGAPNSFLLNRVFANQANIALCPKTIVVQSPNGIIAVAPLTAVIVD